MSAGFNMFYGGGHSKENGAGFLFSYSYTNTTQLIIYVK